MTTVARLRDLLDKATPRPWDEAAGVIVSIDLAEPILGMYGDGQADADLIVALVNCADELLAVAEAARKIADDIDDHGRPFLDYLLELRSALVTLDRKLGDQ